MGKAFDSVDEGVLKQLDSTAAVKLLHKLIYSEAKRLTISFDLISVPYEVDTPDGGVDAVFKTGTSISGSELIFEGKTYYQVKSGENVTFTEAGLKNVLCEDRVKEGAEEKDLKPKVREIAEENGTLVLFFTGRSAPRIEDALKNARKVIEHYLPKTKLNIRIIQADNIIAILDNFLSLRHDLLHIQGFPGLLFDEWERDPLMGNYFENDEQRTKKIDDLKHLIRSTLPEDSVIRVTGYPGIGKTRSVLEAVRDEDLRPLVVYFGKPSYLTDSGLLVEMGVRRENEAIVIVDECSHHSHIQLVTALAGSKSKIKLVTIYNEPNNTVRNVKNFDLNESEVLKKESIINIIESYNLPNDVASRWEPFCDGSPRVAHMIAENLSRNTGDVLSHASLDLAMERILANTEDLDSDTYKKRKNVLSWLSLFHKFGWGRQFAEERKFIINKIRDKTGYSEDDIESVVQDLKTRKVLQGDETLYISPRLLHIQAWVWWWDKYGGSFDLSEMRTSSFGGDVVNMSDELYEWFTQMFEYAAEVRGASEVVERLLSNDGPLSGEPELIEALSGNFFLSLTKADPERALFVLEKWISSKTDEQLRTQSMDRMNLVRVLETIAVWGPLFTRAAELLLRVAATEENHTYSNNSEGTFAALFSNAWGKVAPTEASPPERFPVMERAVNSQNERVQLMGLNALDQALETTHFSRVVGAEIQGLREEPKLWTPDTYQEIHDAIRTAWLLLLQVTPTLSGELRERAIEIIQGNIRGLLLLGSYGHEYIGEYTSLVKNGIISGEDAVDTVNTARRYDFKDMSENMKDAIGSLSTYLEGTDVTSKLKRYIAYNSTEDWWGDDEDIARSNSRVADLVKVIFDDPSLIDKNQWLFTQEAKNAHKLGQGLAELDEQHKLRERLFELQEKSDKTAGDNASFVFVSGYLWKLERIDHNRWQEALDNIASNENLVHWYAEACWRSCLDDHNAEIILNLVKQGKVELGNLNLFRLGGMIKDISDKVFDEWIEYLLGQHTLEAAAIAIDLFSTHYIFKEDRPIPADLTLRVITAKPLVSEQDRQVARSIDYDWSTIAERYVEQYPGKTASLFEFILGSLSKDDTIFSSHRAYAKNVLNKIIELDPEQAWKSIAARFNGGMEEFQLQHFWLGGGVSFGSGRPDGAISLFPKKLILDWVDEDPTTRASKIARMIPHDYDSGAAGETWYATILDRYGQQKDVQGALYANIGTEGWSGPASLHYAEKLEKVRRFAEVNKNSVNVQKWVASVINSLDKQVKDARINEERRGF